MSPLPFMNCVKTHLDSSGIHFSLRCLYWSNPNTDGAMSPGDRSCCVLKAVPIGVCVCFFFYPLTLSLSWPRPGSKKILNRAWQASRHKISVAEIGCQACWPENILWYIGHSSILGIYCMELADRTYWIWARPKLFLQPIFLTPHLILIIVLSISSSP